MALEQPGIAGAAPSGVKHDEIERRRVGGPIIRRMRNELEMCEFAHAQFVHDLARLGVAVIVFLGSLEGSEHFESATGKVGIDQRVLQ